MIPGRPTYRAATRPDVACPVCGARRRAACTALDGLPLPGGHPERDESTPIADAITVP